MKNSILKHAKTLELNIVLDRLCEHALSAETKRRIKELSPSGDFNEVKERLTETDEAFVLMSRYSSPDFSASEEIPSILSRSNVSASLSAHELIKVASLLAVVRKAKDYRVNNSGNESLFIDKYFSMLTPNNFLEDKINFVIKSEDEINDKASEELFSIRRKKSSAQSKVRDALEKIIRGPKSKFLQEAIITTRDGRFVVPVKVESKGEIKGIVHDTSSSGSTVFVEPMSVVEANNEMRVLEIKEKEEIARILSELSLIVAEFSDSLSKTYEAVIKLDFIFAKARYGVSIGGNIPEINSDGIVYLKNARHPLIPARQVVPVTVGVGSDYDTLVITGPNTGGKTVTLKTVGLFCLMTMCGLMIPVDDSSKVCVFSKIFADIGDEQSIEQSLSTFSSHMVNIISILSEADENSLVLFDELCAGTDPVEGAALAKSILIKLSDIGAKTVATTHYPELKAYAIDSYRVQNAACEFDIESLRPTYKLTVGIPGSSNAFAISEKLGLESEIIEIAKGQLSEEDVKFERLAGELEKERKKAYEESLAATRLKSEIAETKKRCDNLENELKQKQKKVIDESRQRANDIVNDARNRSAVLLNELEELKKSLSAENSADTVSKARALYKKSMEELENSADPVEAQVKGEKLKGAPKTGDTVILASINKDATVLEVSEKSKKALVMSGSVKMWVSFDGLLYKKAGKTPENKKFRTVTGVKSRAERIVSGEIDLRGMASDEAILELDRYLDSAVLSGIGTVTVIHGKGTGVLRKSVQSYLKGHKSVKSYRLGVFGEGESGVTVVELN